MGSGSLTTYMRAPARPAGSGDASSCFSYAFEGTSGETGCAWVVDAAAFEVGVAETRLRTVKGEWKARVGCAAAADPSRRAATEVNGAVRLNIIDRIRTLRRDM